MNISSKEILYMAIGLTCLSPWINSAAALIMGMVFSTILGNPFKKSSLISKKLLSYSVIGLGAGMNLQEVAKAGLSGAGFTFISILFVFLVGLFLTKLFKTQLITSLLIIIGTAICGGSAIAAASPVLKAKDEDISMSLGVVFILNAMALLIFPTIGHYFDLSQQQFGLWSALAIHDTSSVVGATLIYGDQALKLGTTIKLTRALWILPLTFLLSYFYHRFSKNSETASKPKRPWFILGFIIMSALCTWLPQMIDASSMIVSISKKVLVLTLFLIGSGINLSQIKSVGPRPFLMAISLWLIVSLFSFIVISNLSVENMLLKEII